MTKILILFLLNSYLIIQVKVIRFFIKLFIFFENIILFKEKNKKINQNVFRYN